MKKWVKWVVVGLLVVGLLAVAIAAIVSLCHSRENKERATSATQRQEAFNSNFRALTDPRYRTTAEIKLQPYGNKVIHALIEENFNSTNQQQVSAVGKMIWDLGGYWAIDIVCEYTKDDRALVADNARWWYEEYCPRKWRESREASGQPALTPPVPPAPAPVPAPVPAPAPALVQTNSEPKPVAPAPVIPPKPVAPRPPKPAAFQGQPGPTMGIPDNVRNLQGRIQSAETSLALAKANAAADNTDPRRNIIRRNNIERKECQLQEMRVELAQLTMGSQGVAYQ